MRTPFLLALALLVGPALAGCSGGGGGGRAPLPEEWLGHDLREPGWQNVTLQGGETVAFEAHWNAGARVKWEYVTTAPQPPPFLHFQLVRMECNDVGTARPLVSEDARDGTGERTVVQSGTHQLDWMNEWTQPLTVAVKVPSGTTMILYAKGEGPGCLFGSAAEAMCLRPPLPPS